MEIVKYLCEFFFEDFWHFLGLAFLLFIIFRDGDKPLIIIGNKNIKDK